MPGAASGFLTDRAARAGNRGPAQLDLFLDSRTVALVNDAVAALAARDPAAAAEAVAKLRAHDPGHETLPSLAALAEAVAKWRLPAADAAAIAAAAACIDRDLEPLARRVLADAAESFIAAHFRDLAGVAVGLGYDPAHPSAYRAALCLRCGDWAGAEQAAMAIDGCGRLADALQWLAVARYRAAGLDAALTVLFALAWEAPSRFAATVDELGDDLLRRQWHGFERACDWCSVPEAEVPAWFPAWYLLEHPAAASLFDGADAPPMAAAEAAWLLLRLLESERRGDWRALAMQRERLRELNAAFFALYMERRSVRHR
jgi:hypothetical protein